MDGGVGPAVRRAGRAAPPRARFRFVQVGTDSWWWGVDDFGIYGTQGAANPAEITSITRGGSDVLITWTGGGALDQVQISAVSPAGPWTDLGAPTAQKTAAIPAGSGAQFIRVVTP